MADTKLKSTYCIATRYASADNGQSPNEALNRPALPTSPHPLHFGTMAGRRPLSASWRDGRDRIVVSTSRCGRENPGSNPGHGREL